MKKKYQTPKVTIREISPITILAGSPNLSHEGSSPGYYSKSYSDFEEDDIEEE